MCESLAPLANGTVSITPGDNLLSHGLGSVATYSCDPGYALMGQTTRTCEDISGGTVTKGTWSGTEPSCSSQSLSMYLGHYLVHINIFQWSCVSHYQNHKMETSSTVKMVKLLWESVPATPVMQAISW